MMHRKIYTALLIFIILLAGTAWAGPKDPITGDLFEQLRNSLNFSLQHELEDVFPEREGYFITGPLDPFMTQASDVKAVYSAVRVICPDIQNAQSAAQKLNDSDRFKRVTAYLPEIQRAGVWDIFPRHSFRIRYEGNRHHIMVMTTQELRYLIWLKRVINAGVQPLAGKEPDYCHEVARYLDRVDHGETEIEAPKATDYDLPEQLDFYAESPDYVISGYQNYKDFLYSHAEIETGFATGILAFIPTTETLASFIDNAPPEAYPNKEREKLQEEYREFFERGGDVSIMQTLTKAGFDTLRAGEYFFAVGINDKIRFGRELTREEVKRIESETGRKIARGNHAFLFPGEPVLTAGAFFIESTEAPKLVAVNAQSGHYFYSNITKTIREDISEKSDHYLLTLGHFFRIIQELGIDNENILISKF
ncbi:MAG: hypothetical protein GF404_01795 [candidate division Zixibacteria bacterium]|nr:hypothetical protein [candidate division Zixibacteria bacterium]